MPYIKQEDRNFFEGSVTDVRADVRFKGHNMTPGILNYLFTKIAKEYVDTLGLSYQTINDVVGAFNCASNEFYRRVAVPYEIEKIKQNGDL